MSDLHAVYKKRTSDIIVEVETEKMGNYLMQI